MIFMTFRLARFTTRKHEKKIQSEQGSAQGTKKPVPGSTWYTIFETVPGTPWYPNFSTIILLYFYYYISQLER